VLDFERERDGLKNAYAPKKRLRFHRQLRAWDSGVPAGVVGVRRGGFRVEHFFG
jgi:hypothetical protein